MWAPNFTTKLKARARKTKRTKSALFAAYIGGNGKIRRKPAGRFAAGKKVRYLAHIWGLTDFKRQLAACYAGGAGKYRKPALRPRLLHCQERRRGFGFDFNFLPGELKNKYKEVVKMKKHDVKAQFEVAFDANGYHFLVIYGRHENGGFCCIPNWNIGCEMSDTADIFYNYEKLIDAGFDLDNAKAVAEMIKKAGDKVAATARNYGRITFEKDLPAYELVIDGTTADGNEYELATVEPSAGNPCAEPIVKFKDRAFLLSWEDIVSLAERAGLFDDSESVIKALTGKGVLL